MQSQLPLYPEQASNFAPQVDALMIFIIAVCLFFAVAVTIAILVFLYKFKRKSPGEIGVGIHGNMFLEAAWIGVPLVLALVMFAWGAVVYVDFRHAPPDTLDIYVIGKQWMWKLQQPNGQKEINELHVPVNHDVRLILGSEDVIHNFSIPAFRVKMDDVPGHYNTLWFRATKTGKYHFYCSQYCGTNHAVMGGWVTVMEPDEYTAWLAGSSSMNPNPVLAGEKLFAERACSTCHQASGKGPAPSLNGVFGGQVRLADGSIVTADESYIRESMLNPNAKIVAGYQPVMPTYQGQLTEEQTLDLISYVRSLQGEAVPSTGAGVVTTAASQSAGKK